MNDRLEIKVIGAEGLVEVDGGACNPFAIVRCNQDIEQTMVANHTTHPHWNSATMLFNDISDYNVDHIIVTVMHKDLSVQADAEIGHTIINLRTVILSPTIESDEWHVLQGSPGTLCAVSGRIRLECTYFIYDGDDILPQHDDILPKEVSHDMGNWPNMLVGTIFRGRSIYLKGKEPVDAYVTVKVGTNKHSTAVARRSSNPHWGEHTFKLPASDGSTTITVKVKHRGVLRNRLIGTCSIPMVEVAAHGEVGFTRRCQLHRPGGLVDNHVGSNLNYPSCKV